MFLSGFCVPGHMMTHNAACHNSNDVILKQAAVLASTVSTSHSFSPLAKRPSPFPSLFFVFTFE